MKRALRILARAARLGLMMLGLLVLLAGLFLFSSQPWKLYKRLSACPGAVTNEPSHILVMGGSGIPGESGFMRTFYGARAAELHPDADLLVAMPLPAEESDASRAYLDELRLRGVPAERMAILPDGRNTREQALRMAAFLKDDIDAATVLIVTDPTHVRRTAGCLRKAGIARYRALPAWQLSLEDPIPWKAEELEPEPDSAAAGESPSMAQELVPDVGSIMILRYTLWNNIGYTHDSLREYAALAYYRLRGWL